MNWMSKEKAKTKQATEKQKMKDFFRRHRKPLKPEVIDDHNKGSPISAPNVAPGLPASSPTFLYFDGKKGKNSACSSGEHADKGRKTPERISYGFHGTDTEVVKHQRSDELSLSVTPLVDMDLKSLAKTVKINSVPVSTDLVHLEMMKRVYAFQRKQLTLEKEEDKTGGSHFTVQYQHGDGNWDRESQGHEPVIKLFPCATHDRVNADYDQVAKSDSVPQQLQHQLFGEPDAEADSYSPLRSQSPSSGPLTETSTERFYWDLASFGQSYGTENPALAYSKSQKPRNSDVSK